MDDLKWPLILFSGFFVTFFIIGMISGRRVEPEKSRLVAFAASKIHMNVENEQAILLMTGSNNSILSYRAGENILDTKGSIDDYKKAAGLFPMDADEIVRGALLGFASIPTYTELVKSGAKAEVKGNKAINFAAIIFGAISGYSLGYHMGKPAVNDEMSLAHFNEKSAWPPLVLEVNQRRIRALKNSYFWLIKTHDRKKDSTVTEAEDFFMRNSFNKLFMIDSLSAKMDPNWMLMYTEKKNEWLKVFVANRASGKESDYLFADDYYGMSYFQDAGYYQRPRIKFLKRFLSSLSAESSKDYNLIAERIGKDLMRSDIKYLTYVPKEKLGPEISLGIFKALLRYPNFSTLFQMKVYASEANREQLWQPGSAYDRTLKEMISNYPLDRMED